ncbi:hypothetical protein CRUP_017686 [Coryphaenoides rupestris]|nr:hypothetical protein CRUP_017686 [Coryphaenoides rupestris]
MFQLSNVDTAGQLDYKSLCYIITHGEEHEDSEGIQRDAALLTSVVQRRSLTGRRSGLGEDVEGQGESREREPDKGLHCAEGPLAGQGEAGRLGSQVQGEQRHRASTVASVQINPHFVPVVCEPSNRNRKLINCQNFRSYESFRRLNDEI